jgi:tetratricopeptide (TPR) repeat protein
MFDQAIKLDPNFALAHAGVANVCGLIYELRERSQIWMDKGTAACDRAAALEPQLAEVAVVRARLAYAQKKYDDAIHNALVAIERRSDCEGAYNVLGRAYFASGRFREAAEVVDRAIEANGDDYNVYIPYTVSLERLGEKDRAQQVRERMNAVLEKQLELVPEDVRARILLSGNYANAGNEDDAIRHLQTAVALRPGDSNVLYNAACTYGVLQKKAEALDLLRRAREAGYGNLEWASRDPDLACLRDEPEFKQLCELS